MKQSKLGIYDKFNLLIANMKMKDIPTQNSRVFVHFKQYHAKKDTKPVEIVDNKVEWDEDVSMKCTLPKNIKKQKKKFLLSISIRFENSSGRGYVRYGSVSVNITELKICKEHHFEVPLENCIDSSTFSADLINFNPLDNLSSPNDFNINNLNTSPAMNQSNNSPSRFSGPEDFSSTPPTDTSVSEISQSTNNGTNTMSSQISTFKDTEVKVKVFDNVEVKVKELKMKELETQVDGIVAQIINNSF